MTSSFLRSLSKSEISLSTGPVPTHYGGVGEYGGLEATKLILGFCWIQCIGFMHPPPPKRKADGLSGKAHWRFPYVGAVLDSGSPVTSLFLFPSSTKSYTAEGEIWPQKMFISYLI